MKYLKTFENYEGDVYQKTGKMNGQAQVPQDFDGNHQAEFPELENSADQKRVLASAFEKLSPAEKEAAFKGVEELAAKLGCTVEDLTDPSFLEKDFEEAGAQSIEEGLLGDLGARTKKFFGNLYRLNPVNIYFLYIRRP